MNGKNDRQAGNGYTIGTEMPMSITRIGVYWTAPRIVAFIAAISLIAWPWMTVVVDDMSIFDPSLIFGVCVSGVTAVVAGSIASIKPTKGS